MYNEHVLARYAYFNSFLIEMVDDFKPGTQTSSEYSAGFFRAAAMNAAGVMAGAVAIEMGLWEPELSIFA